MTLEELWNTPIYSKWVPVIIEGKPIKDKFLRDELILRLDRLIFPNTYTSKSPDLFVSIENIKDYLSGYQSTNICKSLKDQFNVDLDENQLFGASIKAYDKDLTKWIKWWGKNPYYGEASIFTTEIDSERCFFNLKNGKIKPTVKYVGSWPGNIGEFKEEIDWFAKEFPQVDLTVTFTDDNDELTDYRFLATLHIHNGTYELVDTKNYKNVSKLHIYSGKNYKRKWKNFLFKFIRLGHNIQKRFNEDVYIYWSNYKLLNKFYYYHYLLSTRELACKTAWWIDKCIEKNGVFWKFLRENNQ